jgi:hypothetical protein
VSTSTASGSRTAAAIAHRRHRSEAAVQRVHNAITALRREQATRVTVAAVARRRGRVPHVRL